MATVAAQPVEPQRPVQQEKDRMHCLHVLVTAAVVAGAVLGLPAPELAGGAAVAFLLGIIPTLLPTALTDGNRLQTLFVALLVGLVLQQRGETGKPVLKAVSHLQAVSSSW